MSCARCKYCRAEIVWATSARYGNRIPLDALPVPTGTWTLHEVGTSRIARYVRNDERPALIDQLPPRLRDRPLLLYRRHDLTCAGAQRVA